MSYLVEDLIESVKDRSFAPISQTTFQDADILRILNEELSLALVSAILTKREDFFLARKTIQLVGGKDHYPVPKRAIGNSIKALFSVDSAGSRRALKRRDIDRIDEYSNSGGPSAEFYFESDELVLMQAPSDGADTLLCVYPRRPSQLVLTTSCAKITGISSDATHSTFTVDTDLTGTLSVGSYVDFLSSKSPYQLWSEEVAITAITATTIEVLKSAVVDVDGSVEPVANDYICPYGQANIAQVPIEFQPVLAQKGANRMLTALGDQAKLQAGMAIEKMMLGQALDLIQNRAESSPLRPSRKRGLIRTFRG